MCYYTALTFGAKLQGRRKLARRYYELARFHIGPCFTMPCQHLVSAFLIMTILTRVILADVKQAILYASLAARMVDLCDVSPEIRICATTIHSILNPNIARTWPPLQAPEGMTSEMRVASLWAFVHGQVMNGLSLIQTRPDAERFETLMNECLDLQRSNAIGLSMAIGTFAMAFKAFLQLRLGNTAAACVYARECVRLIIEDKYAQYFVPLLYAARKAIAILAEFGSEDDATNIIPKAVSLFKRAADVVTGPGHVLEAHPPDFAKDRPQPDADIDAKALAATDPIQAIPATMNGESSASSASLSSNTAAFRRNGVHTALAGMSADTAMCSPFHQPATLNAAPRAHGSPIPGAPSAPASHPPRQTATSSSSNSSTAHAGATRGRDDDCGPWQQHMQSFLSEMSTHSKPAAPGKAQRGLSDSISLESGPMAMLAAASNHLSMAQEAAKYFGPNSVSAQVDMSNLDGQHTLPLREAAGCMRHQTTIGLGGCGHGSMPVPVPLLAASTAGMMGGSSSSSSSGGMPPKGISGDHVPPRSAHGPTSLGAAHHRREGVLASSSPSAPTGQQSFVNNLQNPMLRYLLDPSVGAENGLIASPYDAQYMTMVEEMRQRKTTGRLDGVVLPRPDRVCPSKAAEASGSLPAHAARETGRGSKRLRSASAQAFAGSGHGRAATSSPPSLAAVTAPALSAPMPPTLPYSAGATQGALAAASFQAAARWDPTADRPHSVASGRLVTLAQVADSESRRGPASPAAASRARSASQTSLGLSIHAPAAAADAAPSSQGRLSRMSGGAASPGGASIGSGSLSMGATPRALLSFDDTASSSNQHAASYSTAAALAGARAGRLSAPLTGGRSSTGFATPISLRGIATTPLGLGATTGSDNESSQSGDMETTAEATRSALAQPHPVAAGSGNIFARIMTGGDSSFFDPPVLLDQGPSPARPSIAGPQPIAAATKPHRPAGRPL